MPEHHELMGGKLHVYRRPHSTHWQCSTYLDGKNWRVSTKEESLAHAKDFAEDWYLGLKGKHLAGVLKTGKTFKQAADQFLLEYEVITQGQRSPQYVSGIRLILRVHLLPFFGNRYLTEITPGLVQEYRIHRMTSRPHPKTGTLLRPGHATLYREIVALRQVLKTAYRQGWLPYVPDVSPPYRISGKVSHRAWLSPEEYKRLYQATRERAKNAKGTPYQQVREQLHDYILFMANTGLRTDEAARLEYRDVAIVTDAATGERILEIEVRGKRGVGFCKSMTGAVMPFERLRKRNKRQPTDRIFGQTPRRELNLVLDELKMKKDRDGNRRSAYSLRHTYICMRLMEGADIYQIAKNCRTSVEMIEKFYAAHIKNMLDAAAINVRRPKPASRKAGQPRPRDQVKNDD